jgi:hypothetical protein
LFFFRQNNREKARFECIQSEPLYMGGSRTSIKKV